MDSLLSQPSPAPSTAPFSQQQPPVQPRLEPQPRQEQQEPLLSEAELQESQKEIDAARELTKAEPWLNRGGHMSFRRLHQLADGLAGRINAVDSAEAIATVETLAMVPSVQAVMYDDNDMQRLHRMKTYIPEHLQQTQSRKRKLRKLPADSPDLTAQEAEVLHPLHLTAWEEDVVWDDNDSVDSGDRNPRARSRREGDESWPASNPLMEKGLWTKGIIWDADEVLEDSDDELNTWQLHQHSQGRRQPIGDILPPASVVYGYYDPVPLWIDVNDPNVHVMVDRGGSMRYMGEEEDDEDDEQEQLETAEPTAQEPLQITHPVTPERPALDSSTPYSKREKERILQAQKLQRLREMNMLFDPTASLTGNKRLDDDDPRRRRVIAAPAVDHSTYASRHQQPVELSRRELRLFHRPRATPRAESWSLAKPRGTSNLFAGRSRNYRGGELLPQMSKGEDLLPIKGDFIVVEYVEEFPPIITNSGMGSRILNYYRATEPSENKDDLEREANSIQRRARLPRHLQRLQRRENDSNDRLIPKFPEGQTVVLEPTDESPFLGDIPPGETQPCLSNNLYRIPLFEQRTLGNDFLLIRDALPREKTDATAASKRDRYRCYIRELQRVYIGGQQEPQKAVPIPSKKTTAFQHEWIRLHIARYLKRLGNQTTTVQQTQRALFESSYFPDAAIKKILRELAESHDGNVSYQKKPDLSFPSIDDLEKQISVEEVCLNECSAAGEKQLEAYGIREMRSPTIVSNALDRLLKLASHRRQLANDARMKARQLKNTPLGPQTEKLAEVLERESTRTDRLVNIARFLREKLSLTPWNLTGEFVQVHLQAQGSGLLQLTGLGDPSGRGEAFSYLRESRQKTKRKTNDSQSITGTGEDLRKLTVPEAKRTLVQMGMEPSQVQKLKRWDLIHLIREHANQAAGAGQEHAITKFARGSKQNHAAEIVENKALRNQIWGYQQAALSSLELPSDDSDDDDDAEHGENEGGDDKWEKEVLEGFEQNRPSQARQAPGGEDARALAEMRQELRQGDAARLNAQILISAEEQKQPEVHLPQRHRPQKVVKRIERVIDANGKEKVTIRFILDEGHVEKTAENRREKRLKLAQDAIRQRRRQDGIDDEQIKSHRYSSGGSLQLGALRRKAGVDAPELDAEADAFTNVQQRGRNRRQVDTAPSRLPQASLAVLLEEIWFDLWAHKAAEAFRLPVDARRYPDYLAKVKSPIDLSTIRNKIGALEYTSLQTFIDDLQLMLNNSVAYNGPTHVVTHGAKTLLSAAQVFVDTPVNREKFRNLERELQAKNAALHRTPRSIAIPSVAKTAAAPVVAPQAVDAPASAIASALSAGAQRDAKPAPTRAATPTISSYPSAAGTPMTEHSVLTPQSFGTATPSMSQSAMGQDMGSEVRAAPKETIADVFAALYSDSDEDSDGTEAEGENNTQLDAPATQDTDRVSDVTSSTARFAALAGDEGSKLASSEENADIGSQPMDIEFSQPLRPTPTIPDEDGESSGEEEVLEEG